MAKPGLVSMSGYGRAVAEARGVKVTCEIRTVNHRHLDLALSLPGGYLWADPEVRPWIAAALARGRADVTIALELTRPPAGASPVRLDVARAWGKALIKLARELRLPPPTAGDLAGLPGVASRPEAAIPPKLALALMRRAVDGALAALLGMRRREGAALARDLLARAAALEAAAAEVGRRWPEARKALDERQAARVRELLERLGEGGKAGAVKELLSAADRGDVSEELTRLASHLAQFRDVIRKGGAAGRTLDFLAQELHREVNTTGSKSQDAALTRIVVAMKEDVDRIKEQAANVE